LEWPVYGHDRESVFPQKRGLHTPYPVPAKFCQVKCMNATQLLERRGGGGGRSASYPVFHICQPSRRRMCEIFTIGVCHNVHRLAKITRLISFAEFFRLPKILSQYMEIHARYPVITFLDALLTLIFCSHFPHHKTPIVTRYCKTQ